MSLFVTNYANLSKQTKLFFSVAQNDFEFKKTFEAFYGELFIFNHYLKFVNLSAGSDIYMKTIQNFLVSQGHLLYSYDRTFLSLSRTNSYISQNFRLLNIKQKQNLKPFEKPVLYLSAGPSLQHNIDFVKKNQNYFTIVAIYATMPILERNGIKPDIITQYDEQDVQVLNTLAKLKDINYFKDTIFIFASHVNAKLMNSFPKENIFIFQAMFELKENFGTLTSPSIGELTYALLLLFQAKEVYLLGLDFAMDVESGDTHIEGHSGSGAFNKLKDLEESDDKNYSYRKNTILVKGNFLAEVKSVPVFKTNIDTFAQFSEMFKDSTQNIYNLSNGAYLNGTTPLKIEDINLSSFSVNEKEALKNELSNAFITISEAGYNQKDLEKLNLKLSSVKKIKKNLDQFQKMKKYKDFEEYKGHLINLIQNILFEKHQCEDLQSILINYSSHNLHHIFYLFDLESKNDNKKYIYEINKNLLTQLNKIVDTYVISISYSQDENSIALKKLNKYLKEYSIKNSIYSEPFFKELVETSKQGYQYEFGMNSIGFFAIEDNLSNKNFICYVKELLNKFPEIKLKLFYFFDFQKVQAQYIFKQELSRIELIIPHNINTITSTVELWLETYNNTINVKKIDDIILNNYENIYSSMFTQIEYQSALNNIDEEKEEFNTDKFTLTKKIKHNFVLPNTKYFEFANSLKFDIDKDLLNEKYLKEYIGFFAIKENLQQEFVNKIVEICNKFQNVKFSVFYFDEVDVKEFIKIFGRVINRFNFITPKNIFDITDNIEVWVQASIKNQSFLHTKIYGLINNTVNIHPIVLKEEYAIKDTSTNYLECLIENYNETIFTKALNDNLDEERLQNTDPEDNIGFLATEDNLEDKEFIKLMSILFEKNYNIRYKAFYFNEEQKDLTSIIFADYIQQIDFIIPITIYDIVENISTYIYSFINFKKPKTSNYHKIWQILNDTKVNLFKIHLFEEIKDENIFNYSLKLIDKSKRSFTKSIVSNIYKDSSSYDILFFKNIFNQKIKLDNSAKNTLAFLATNDNINDDEFIKYLLNLKKVHPSITINAYYFNDSDSKLVKEKLHNTNFSIFKFTKDNFFNNLKIFINNKNSIFYTDIEQKMLPFNKNVFYLAYNRELSRINLSECAVNKDDFYLNSLKEIGIDPSIFEKFNYNYQIILANNFLEKNSNDIQVNNTTLEYIIHYMHIEFALYNNSFIEKIYQLRKLHLPNLFKSNEE
ncbi:MAG: hypothetical protein C0626_12670 [Arcobacter sp.]|nr:MAG: hypothetical protein C0626_12670 [Arcobacter sp.]